MKIISALIFTLLFSASFFQPVFAKTANTEAKMSSTQIDTVNLNQAGAKEIAKVLTGIGPKKAQAIIDYRNTHGDFKAVEELASVKGIGVATIAKNHKRILLK